MQLSSLTNMQYGRYARSPPLSSCQVQATCLVITRHLAHAGRIPILHFLLTLRLQLTSYVVIM
jgi:hypothetical protein